MDTNPPNSGQPEPIEAQVVATQAVRQTPPMKKSRLGMKLVLFFLLLGLGGSVLLNMLLFGSNLQSLEGPRKVREEFVSHNRSAKNKVAIITVDGAILTSEGFVKRQIDRAAKDPNVKAVVLRINSPGGTMSGSDYLYHHLNKLSDKSDIPIVASFGSLAASGGYYIAMAVGDKPDTIFAEPTTWTGSIGVVIPHYDLSELLGKWGVKEDSIASEPLKTMGSLAKPMSEEEKEIFNGLVQESFQRFKDVIKQGRPKFAADPEALDRLATGQIYTAQQAKKNGLVDKIGFIEEAVGRAVELTGLSSKNVKVVRYKPEPTLADIMFGSQARSSQPDMAALLNMTTPRPYYIYSWPMDAMP
jgi:protease-4